VYNAGAAALPPPVSPSVTTAVAPYRATYTGGDDIDLPEDSRVTVLREYHGPNDGSSGVAKIAHTPGERDDVDGEGIWEVSLDCLERSTTSGRAAAGPALEPTMDRAKIIAWIQEEATAGGWDLEGETALDFAAYVLERYPVVAGLTPEAEAPLPSLSSARERVARSHRVHTEIMTSLSMMRSTGKPVNPMVIWQKLAPLGHMLESAGEALAAVPDSAGTTEMSGAAGEDE